jgi:hypothetical protein
MYKGQGLTNYVDYYKSFIYHGHGGHVPGYNSDFRYLPEHNMGFAIMINGENQGVIDDLSLLIKAYQTKDLPQEPIKLLKIIHEPTQIISGYYIGVDYKFVALKFFEKIKYLKRLWYEGDTLYVKNVLDQSPHKYYSVGNNEYRSEFTNRIAFVQINDPVEGQVIYGNMGLLKRISPVYAYVLLVIFWALFIVPVTISFFALLRLLIYVFGKKKDKVALWISLWPFIPVSFLLVIIIALIASIQTNIDIFFLLGNMGPLSILIFVGTIGYALASLWSVYYIFKNRHTKMSWIFYYHSAIASIFNFIFTIYFFSNGLIGIMTWT